MDPKKMGKNGGIIVIISVLALLITFSENEALAKKPIVLRLGHTEAVVSTRETVCQYFKKRVDELTSGELAIESYPGGILGTIPSMQEQVAMGTLEMTLTTAGLVAVHDPNKIQNLLELPYLFDTYAQAWAFMDTPYVTKFYDSLIPKGIRYLSTWDNGFRHMTNNIRAIYKPEDMQGLKIRVTKTEISIEIIKALGANPVPMAYTELYTALSTGVVDGQENPFMNIFSSKFYEVQKYMSITKHQYSTLPLIISERVWKKLTESHQKAIKQAAMESATFYRTLDLTQEETQRNFMEKEGMKINDVTDMAPFRKQCQVVYEWAKKNWGKDKIEELMAEVEIIKQQYPAGKSYFGKKY